MPDTYYATRFWKPGSIADPNRPRPMREQDLLSAVIEMAGWLGWRTYHPRYSIASARGWPDLVLCKPPRLLFIELKTDGRKPSTYQTEWLEALRQCNAEAAVWWTRQWFDGSIERILRGEKIPEDQ